MSPEIDDEKRLREHRPDVYAEFWRKHGERVIGMAPELGMGFGEFQNDADILRRYHSTDWSAIPKLWASQKWRAGVLLRWGSVWIGAHWSPTNKRLCVNLIPFITVWVCPPGGITP